ncbi:hypothetical protein [Phenylobacterium sp.]|uniref:phage protein n=1 Tax=Phenylobacterium sp. TaxID=1871053 RepID=UPI0035AFB35A
MSNLYLRKVSLIVADDEEGLDLSELKIVFRVRQWDIQTPNTLQARVYNLSEATAGRIQKEFTRVVLQAGYEDGPFEKIFDGTIVQTKRGRDSGVDTYLDIFGGDGDEAYAFAVVNTCLAAGATRLDQFDAIAQAMKPYGVRPGSVPANLKDDALPRGVVMHGMARDLLMDLADATDTNWSIQHGVLQLVPRESYLPGEAVVLTSETGMIGRPEQTEGGITVRSLLRSDIRMGARVHINNSSILLAPIDQSAQGRLEFENLRARVRVTEDGFYRVLCAEHFGDTRGNDFYTDMICVAATDPAPQAQIDRGRA